MNLTAALESARSSLMASGIQSSVISRNIAGASAAGYSRKIAVLDNLPGTGVYVAAIQRAASSGLYTNVLTATSSSAKQSAIYDGLQKIAAATVDDPELDQSPTAQLNALKKALQQYANAPDNTTLAQAAVTSAKDMATALNQATQTVQSVREGADADMNTSVQNINRLLSQFQTVNTAIVKGTISGDDITDYLDQRDSIVSQLSQELGVTMSIRPNGDAALYTDSGVVLFDKTARAVSFRAHQRLYGRHHRQCRLHRRRARDRRQFGDAAQVRQARGPRPAARPDTVTYQSQLDEVARGLVNAFKESDQIGCADAARRSRSLHLSRRAGDAGERHRLGRPRWHDHVLPHRSIRPRAAIPICCATARSAATSHTNTTPPATAATRPGCSSSSAPWMRRSRSMRPRKASRTAA